MSNNKHAFWQALVLTAIVFAGGILLGIYFENSRVDRVQDFYFDSETEIFDFELTGRMIQDFDLSCGLIKEKSILFADKIYNEARKLEKYNDANEITDEIVSLHKRYDLLRVTLWKNIIENQEKCETEMNTIVYLYDYVDSPINIIATQSVMSNHLIDLKKKYGDEIILIPIAADTGVESLNILREFYGLENYPVIFVNEEIKFETLGSLKDIEKHLF